MAHLDATSAARSDRARWSLREARQIDKLALEIGGIILGGWGMRSVLMPQALSMATAINLARSWLILLRHLGLAARALLHVHRHRDLRRLGSRRTS